MSQFQLYPSFSFDESNVGLRAIRPAGVDRIGLVGEFARGPLNPVIVDYALFRALYGVTLHNGSIGVQVANDQGANDFALVRVLGKGTKAARTITVTGPASAAGTLTVNIDDGTAKTYTVNVAEDDSAAVIAGKINTAITADSANLVVNSTLNADPTKVDVTAETAGLAGNSYTIHVSGTIAGVTVSPSVSTPLAGGTDGPMNATKTLLNGATEVLKLDAVSPGAWGNNINVTITAGSDTGLVNITVEFADDNIIEIYNDVDFTDLYDEDKVVAFRSSVLVTATLLDPTLEPDLAAVQLEDGANGPAVTTQDYIDAINKLEDVYVTFLVAPGIKPAGIDQNAINSTLVAQAEKVDNLIGEVGGLRMAIIPAPRGTKVADLPGLKANIPNSKHAVMVAGWGTYAKQQKLRRYGVSPDVIYVGHMVATPVQVSAAARTSSPFVQAILEVDTPIGTAAQNELTKYRLEALILDPTTGGIHCLNGRSTSTDPAWYWSCIRRVYNKIRMDIFFNMQFIKSEPNDKRLDAVVQNSINAYLDVLLQSRVINGYNPTISNDQNNPAALRGTGLRYVDFGIEPLFPGDFVQFRIARTLTGQIRLG
jgi:phage tail sheath protein FI